MSEKIALEYSEMPPNCPHCKAPLGEMTWHKVRGGPAFISYIAILSCPHCRKVVGSVAS